MALFDAILTQTQVHFAVKAQKEFIGYPVLEVKKLKRQKTNISQSELRKNLNIGDVGDCSPIPTLSPGTLRVGGGRRRIREGGGKEEEEEEEGGRGRRMRTGGGGVGCKRGRTSIY